MTKIQIFGLSGLLAIGCGSPPYAEINGEVAGYTLKAQTVFWGGPFLVMVDQPMDCMDMAWVKRGTNFRDGDEAPLDDDIVALLFTYESDEVVAQNTNLEGDAPVDSRLLITRDGALAVYRATAGELDVQDFSDNDDVFGDFSVVFNTDDEEASLTGDFQLAWCNNLKTRY